MNSAIKGILLPLLIGAMAAAAWVPAEGANPLQEPAATPTWARQGAFRFLRLDGGPAAAEKARLSGWPFTAEQLATLASLYTTHRERVLDLLAEAHINWVWLTWSVGFSWETEAEQRRQCAEMMAACRARGIHVAAYMTGNNMFWHDMFRTDRKTVNWLRRDPEGLPVTYFGQAERFLAQMDHPEWIDLQKRRLKAAVEAGAEAFFFDNCDPWRSGEQPVVTMCRELRRYAREELGSAALIQFNFMPHRLPPYIRHAGLLDWSFCEGHTPPGVFDGHWVVANPAHPAKYAAAVFDGRPVIYETCTVHGFDRMGTSQRTITPRQATLLIAEAAAFGASQSFYVEGGFIHRLVRGERADLETWRAVSAAYGLQEHLSPVFVAARQVRNLLVIGDAAPDADPSEPIEAGRGLYKDRWQDAVLLPLLTRSIPFDFCDIRAVDAARLSMYRVVLVAGVGRAPAPVRDDLLRYAGNGRLYALDSDPALAAVARRFTPDEAGFADLERQAPYRLKIQGGPYVLGNVLDGPSGMLLQLVNYADEPADGLEVELCFSERRLPSGMAVSWFSPCPDTSPSAEARATPEGIFCRVPRLDVWGVVLLSGPEP